MIVALSGSREITEEHKERIRRVIMELEPGTRLITGGCIGVDAYVAEFATSAELFEKTLTVHTVMPWGFELTHKYDRYFMDHCTSFEIAPKVSDNKYRDRNQRMVDLVDKVIAFPVHEEAVSVRSGTWMTIRLARKKGIPVEVYILSKKCV